MIRQSNKVLRTSFGTSLSEINPVKGKFLVNDTIEVYIDTPLEDVKGTKKTFLKDAVIEGNLWQEVDQKAGKQRNVVMVSDDNGRYLVPVKSLTPTTDSEIESKSKVQELSNRVEELLKIAKEEGTKVIDEPSSFLDKKYAGFTGKQILIGTIGVIILVRLFK